MFYTFITLVENKPGVLNRVASLFRRRNFNIESLAVGRTEKPDISRMTVVVDCPNGDMDAHRIESNLYKLVNVIDVQDVTHQPSVTRDLALIKVRVGPERRAHTADRRSPAYARRATARQASSTRGVRSAVCPPSVDRFPARKDARKSPGKRGTLTTSCCPACCTERRSAVPS